MLHLHIGDVDEVRTTWQDRKMQTKVKVAFNFVHMGISGTGNAACTEPAIRITAAFKRWWNFTAKQMCASPAVFHTCNVIRNQTLFVFAHNSHFPLHPPMDAYAWVGKKRRLPFCAHAAGSFSQVWMRLPFLMPGYQSHSLETNVWDIRDPDKESHAVCYRQSLQSKSYP